MQLDYLYGRTLGPQQANMRRTHGGRAAAYKDAWASRHGCNTMQLESPV